VGARQPEALATLENREHIIAFNLPYCNSDDDHAHNDICMKDAEDRDSWGGGMYQVRYSNKIVGGVAQGRFGANGIEEEVCCSISCFSWVPCRGNTVLIVRGNEVD
jgi:hypothetical protein